MPKYEVQLVRRYTNNDSAYIEVEAANEDEAAEIAISRYNDDDIEWSEGDDCCLGNGIEVFGIDKLED